MGEMGARVVNELKENHEISELKLQENQGQREIQPDRKMSMEEMKSIIQDKVGLRPEASAGKEKDHEDRSRQDVHGEHGERLNGESREGAAESERPDNMDREKQEGQELEKNETGHERDPENEKAENGEASLDELNEQYKQELADRTGLNPEDFQFDTDQWEPVSKEEVQAKREEFNSKKRDLREQWEKVTGREWPTDENGNRYEMHHIQPLSMGGKNEVSNIVPVTRENHISKEKGLHRMDGPLSRIEAKVKDR